MENFHRRCNVLSPIVINWIFLKNMGYNLKGLKRSKKWKIEKILELKTKKVLWNMSKAPVLWICGVDGSFDFPIHEKSNDFLYEMK